MSDIWNTSLETLSRAMNSIIASISGMSEFFSNEKFLLPFLSILAASLTVIFLQFISRYVTEKRKKLFAVNYIVDAYYRILLSTLILKRHTIVPHIEAAKRILGGDKGLLDKTFQTDEFDILTDKSFSFDRLLEEYKVLLGCDDITLVQLFEVVNYSHTNERKTRALNEFVKNNLKSAYEFSQKNSDRQSDCLNTYWDYLEAIKHDADRTVSFIIKIAVPVIGKYIKQRQFMLFSKKSINSKLIIIKQVLTEYKDILPEDSYLEKIINGGIQNAL